MITGVSLVALVWICSLTLDRVFGEPTRWHPLVGFGRLAKLAESRFNIVKAPVTSRLCGVVAWTLLIIPPVFLVWILRVYLFQFSPILAVATDCLVVYWAIGWRSLCEHIRSVGQALLVGNIDEARVKISYIVSRDTASLNDEQILSAGLETALENSSDALFASLIWYALAGPAGVVLHRLSNTLDAMWGYKNTRYRYFGWCAARCDDVLNFIPAQLTSLGFSILIFSGRGFRCWFGQGWRWKSINAGSVMASGAASLNIILGGAATYHGETVTRPPLGCGRKPNAGDLERSIRLINHQLLLWVISAVMLGTLL